MESLEEFSEEEKRLYSIAETSYNRALAHYYYPALPEPSFIIDYTKEKGFFINNQTWKITLNLVNTPNIYLEESLENYYFALALHEIGHYVVIPYDGQTNLKLLGAIIESNIMRHFAPIVLNIFADLIVDTLLYEEYSEIMGWQLEIDVQNRLDELKKEKTEKTEKIEELEEEEPKNQNKKRRNSNKRKYKNGPLLVNVTQPPSGLPELEGLSDIWKILVYSYEELWNLKLLPREENEPTIIKDAKKLARIIKKCLRDDSIWQNEIKKFAKIFKPYLSRESKFKEQSNAPPNNSSGMPSKNQENMNEIPKPDNPITIPDDVKETFGDLSEVKNPLLIQQLGDSEDSEQAKNQAIDMMIQIFENVSPDYDIKTFTALLSINGFDNTNENFKHWYRGRAKNMLDFKFQVKKSSETLPFYPTTWRIGDSLEDLDLFTTLLTSPAVIPNITTKKWKKQQSDSYGELKSAPDILIVLDSSGSMGWDIYRKNIGGEYHLALLASFSAIHYALGHGSHIAAINFSEHIVQQSWTNNYGLVEDVLMSYQGNGTRLPTQEMLKIVKKAKNDCLVLLISDLELSNWDAAHSSIQQILQLGHKFAGFFIGGNEQLLELDEFQTLKSKGAAFFCINKEEDMVGLIIDEVKRHY